MRLIPGAGGDEITTREANDLVERFGSIKIGDVPAFDDVSIDPDSGTFKYVIDGEEHSVPVDLMRHRWEGGNR